VFGSYPLVFQWSGVVYVHVVAGGDTVEVVLLRVVIASIVPVGAAHLVETGIVAVVVQVQVLALRSVVADAFLPVVMSPLADALVSAQLLLHN